MRNFVRLTVAAYAAIGLSACATTVENYDYTAFNQEAPRAILVLPALNNTLNVSAPDYFLSTLSRPVGERGYYVFPAHMVKRTLEESGLSDPNLVYQTDTRRLGALFGCDAALYISIERWDSQYIIISTQTTVQFDYELRSCLTGQTLWAHSEQMAYSPQASSSGNPLADLIVQAVASAVERAAPNYMPLAQQANALAFGREGRGFPAGHYLATHSQ